MFIPEFVCGILATIVVEILLLIGYAIFRKKQIDFQEAKSMANIIGIMGEPIQIYGLTFAYF